MSRLRLFGDLKDAGALDEWAAPSQGGPPVGFPAIRPTRNGSPSISFPATGNGVIIVVPAGTDWSPWVQLTAGEAAAYVLQDFSRDEAGFLAEILDRALDAVLTFVMEGLDAAMLVHPGNRDVAVAHDLFDGVAVFAF